MKSKFEIASEIERVGLELIFKKLFSDLKYCSYTPTKSF